MSYPSRHDLDHRPQVVRRSDSFFCLARAAEWRRAGGKAYALEALRNARGYDNASRKLGLFIPGKPEGRAA